MAARKMPKAGRPKRTAGAKVPPRVPGVTGGTMRSRTDADQPENPIGKAGQPPKPKPVRRRRTA